MWWLSLTILEDYYFKYVICGVNIFLYYQYRIETDIDSLVFSYYDIIFKDEDDKYTSKGYVYYDNVHDYLGDNIYCSRTQRVS